MGKIRNSCESPRLYVSLVLISSIRNKKVKNKLDKILTKFARKLEQDNDIKQKFEKIYRTAYGYFYSEFYSKKLEIEYLGYSIEDGPINIRGNRVEGKVRLDYVLVKNYYHNVYSLHIHFNFEKQEFDWDDKNDIFLETISKIYGEIYDNYKSNPERIPFKSMRKLIELFNEKEMFKQREAAYPLTFYTYISVCNLKEDQIKNWENNSVNIYRLLFCHPYEINESEAKKYLSEFSFGTTTFYRNFFQPGGMVSISSPYPEEVYKNHCETFLPAIDEQGNITIEQISAEEGRGHMDYDVIPEYPPLRYLGLLSLEFTGFIEENLRYMYEELLGLRKDKYLRLLKYMLFSRYLDDVLSFYRLLSLEPIKLPVLRNYIEIVIDSKRQATIEKAIENLSNAIINVLMSIMTFMLLILTLVLLFRS